MAIGMGLMKPAAFPVRLNRCYLTGRFVTGGRAGAGRFQTREFEERFIAIGLPYRVVGHGFMKEQKFVMPLPICG